MKHLTVLVLVATAVGIGSIGPLIARAGMPPPGGGYVAAWGQSAYGALGTGFPPCCPIRPFPVRALGVTRAVSVAAGNGTSFAVRRDGSVWAWGNNHRAEFGTPGGAVYRPVRVAGLSGIVQVASAAEDSIALRSDGSVWEWGVRQDGSVGTPARLSQLSNIRQIAASGYYHLAVRADGTVWAWGDLGTGPVPRFAVPTEIPDLHDITQVAIGLDHALALDASGSVWAWGDNYAGQLGHPGARASATAVQVLNTSGRAPFDRVVEVAAGAALSVALRKNGTVWTWGSSAARDLGRSGNMLTPQRVPGVTGVAMLAVSTSHVLALTKNGTLVGWGQNDMGQLGTGTAGTGGCDCLEHATIVRGLSPVARVATGPDHSLAIVGSPPSPPHSRHPVVCARHVGFGPGVVLRAAHARGLAVDQQTGGVFVLVPGGYDPKTGTPACSAAVVFLDGESGRVTRRVTLGRATDVVGPTPLGAGARRIVAAVTGDFVVPAYPGRVTVLAVSGRTVVSRLRGEEPSSVVVDAAHGHAYVTVTDRFTGEQSVIVLGLKHGRIQRRFHFGAERIVLDPEAGRVFVIYGGRFITLNARTSRVMHSAQLPPGGLAGADVDSRTGRVFVSEYGSAPPDEPAPPRTISTFNARSGRLVRVLSTEGNRFQVGILVVDQPAGLVLSSSARRGTVLDARTGKILRSVRLPAGGLTDAATVDPTNGYIYGYDGSAIVELHPRTWRLVRRIPISSYLMVAMEPDAVAHRIYALYATRSGSAVRAIRCCGS